MVVLQCTAAVSLQPRALLRRDARAAVTLTSQQRRSVQEMVAAPRGFVRTLSAAVAAPTDAMWLRALTATSTGGAGGRGWLESAVSKLFTLKPRPAAPKAPLRDALLLRAVRAPSAVWQATACHLRGQRI